MSEPIPDTAAGGIPDLTAAAALVHLITLLHTDPLARPLIGSTRDFHYFAVARGELSLRLDDPTLGAEQLASARSLFGGDTADENSYKTNAVGKVLRTTWRGVPLEVHVTVPREDEVAELKKQLAELREREGALLEQRHQLLDPAVPPLLESGAAVAE